MENVTKIMDFFHKPQNASLLVYGIVKEIIDSYNKLQNANFVGLWKM